MILITFIQPFGHPDQIQNIQFISGAEPKTILFRKMAKTGVKGKYTNGKNFVEEGDVTLLH